MIAPEVSTLVETVMMAARAAILPLCVSTLTSRLLQTIRLAGVDNATGACSPSLVMSVPRPWRQAMGALRSCARALSIADSSFKSLPAKLAPSMNSAAPAQSPRSFGSAEAQEVSSLPRAASSMARLARTSAARNSSVSPARALRRPMRIFCPAGACTTSSPAARARRIIGLVSGLCIQRAPRSNGVSKVLASVMQRPPICDAASTTTTLRLAAMMRRAAAIPAAPAPMTTMSASRGSGAAVARESGIKTGIAAKAADAERKPRRVIVMSWFPGTCGEREQPANLAASDAARQPSW
ncbi:hypothetical protein ACVWY3_006184 [Bradyrhizobium sp. USDA 4486]